MTARKNQSASKAALKAIANAAPEIENAGETVTLEGATEGDGGSKEEVTLETVETAPEASTPEEKTVSVASAFKLSTFTELPGRGSATSRAMYPFADMTAGLMFFAPFSDKKAKIELPKRLSTAASQAGKAAEVKGRNVEFKVRTIVEDGVEGCGVYCVAKDSPEAAEEATA